MNTINCAELLFTEFVWSFKIIDLDLFLDRFIFNFIRLNITS